MYSRPCSFPRESVRPLGLGLLLLFFAGLPDLIYRNERESFDDGWCTFVRGRAIGSAAMTSSTRGEVAIERAADIDRCHGSNG